MNRLNGNFARLIVVLGLLTGSALAQSTDPSLVLHSLEIHPGCHEFRAVYSKNFEGCVDLWDDAGDITKTEVNGQTFKHNIFCGSGEKITVTDSLSRLNFLSASYTGPLYLKDRQDPPSIESSGVKLIVTDFCRVSLHSINVDTCMQTFTAEYSKNFVTCGHIKERIPGLPLRSIHSLNWFCTIGDNIKTTVALNDMAPPPYGPLYMAHGNNNGIASAEIEATEIPTNIRPTAQAGMDSSGRPGDTVTLDGSESGDACGDTIVSYEWQFVSKPLGSDAVLWEATTSTPYFTMDSAGVYEIQLVVTDNTGLASWPDRVKVSSTNSPPIAAASIDPAVLVELDTVVQLDGTDSYDDDGDSFTYKWTLTPPSWESSAVLDDDQSPTPVFTADVQGEYQAELVLTDIHGAASEPVIVTASFNNLDPVAVAGTDQSVNVSDKVELNGGDSYDPNGDTLSYQWSFVSVPAGSEARLNGSAAVADFIADQAGEYVLKLVVNDGFIDSEDVVTVTAVLAPDPIIQSVQEALASLNGLEAQDFLGGARQRVISRRLNIAINLIEAGRYRAARVVLEVLVLSNLDGCAERGQPDTGFFPRRDWVVNCEAQEPIYELLTDASEMLLALQ